MSLNKNPDTLKMHRLSQFYFLNDGNVWIPYIWKVGVKIIEKFIELKVILDTVLPTFECMISDSLNIIPNDRVYDQLRKPGHFCIELQMLLLVGQGQPYLLKTKLCMLAQAHTAIGYTRCWE